MLRAVKKCLLAAAVLCLMLGLAVLSVSADTDYDFLTFDSGLYYGRAELAKLEDGKDLVKVYDIMVKAVEKGEESFILNTMLSVNDIEITVDQLLTVASAYRFDNPQHFWWKSFWYDYYTDGDSDHGNDLIYGVYLEYLDFDISAAKAEFHNACVKFMEDAGIKSGMSEYEISKLLYEAILNSVSYVMGAPNDHNAYGAVIGKQCVCEGYAELYQYLLYLNGIQAHILTGDAGGGHAWNLVRLDGKYYQSDPTWGDQSVISYMYLNTTSELLLKERTLDNHGYPIPECVSDDASYFVVECGKDSMFEDDPDIDNVVEQIKKKGHARLYYTGDGSYGYIDWINEKVGIIRERLGYSGGFNIRSMGVEGILTATDYVVPEIITGDINGDASLSVDDAVYLLYSAMFGRDEFPVNQDCDFNGDGVTNPKDAVYLLYHLFFGDDEYPLHTAV